MFSYGLFEIPSGALGDRIGPRRVLARIVVWWSVFTALTGAMNTAGQIGSFLTTVLFGYIVTAFGSYNAPLVPIAIMSVIASLAWLKIDATRPLIPAGTPE